MITKCADCDRMLKTYEQYGKPGEPVRCFGHFQDHERKAQDQRRGGQIRLPGVDELPLLDLIAEAERKAA